MTAPEIPAAIMDAIVGAVREAVKAGREVGLREAEAYHRNMAEHSRLEEAAASRSWSSGLVAPRSSFHDDSANAIAALIEKETA